MREPIAAFYCMRRILFEKTKIILNQHQEMLQKYVHSVAKSRTSEYPYPILVGHKIKK